MYCIYTSIFTSSLIQVSLISILLLKNHLWCFALYVFLLLLSKVGLKRILSTDLAKRRQTSCSSTSCLLIWLDLCSRTLTLTRFREIYLAQLWFHIVIARIPRTMWLFKTFYHPIYIYLIWNNLFTKYVVYFVGTDREGAAEMGGVDEISRAATQGATKDNGNWF